LKYSIDDCHWQIKLLFCFLLTISVSFYLFRNPSIEIEVSIAREKNERAREKGREREREKRAGWEKVSETIEKTIKIFEKASHSSVRFRTNNP
jgi:hypothetical protein